MRLLRDQLARYRGVLIAVVVLQTIQTIWSLYLPTLNADIIDKGVVTGDTAYIWRTGAVMLAVTLVQIVFAIAAVYFGSRAAMGFGRDVRSELFHQVTDFSAQEVGRVRRAVADHPHHQRRPAGADARADDVHAARRRADHGRRRRRAGAARGRRPVVAPARQHPGPAAQRREHRSCAWCPQFRRDAGAHRRASTRCCASRSPASASCGRSCASPTRASASPASTHELTATRAAGRPADGADVPDRHARAQRARASPCSGSAPTASPAGDCQSAR